MAPHARLAVIAALAFVVAAISGIALGGVAAASLASTPSTEPLFVSGASLDLSAPTTPFVDPIDDAAIDVVARAAWDADPVPLDKLRKRAAPVSKASFIVVHHSDFADPPGPAAILAYHRTDAGFSDIGYHFVVAVDGTVYEGRPLDRVGAHAGVSREQGRDHRKDPDDDAIGIVLDGHFDVERPSPRQLASAVRLIRDLRRRLRLPALHVIGHREVKAKIVEAAGLTFAGHETVCPGEALFQTLPAIRLLSTPPAVVDASARRRPALTTALAVTGR